ncbi:ORF6N domain-containing protein [Comamonas piscis]|uniref:ORF6N domain-containing protein n=1 Tax=Comamonas piscis TaxID=1562974 RepID=A0A7G5EG63_9BURK|nr:ORF6N domain-containing protein [Comamonas piscis]QMV72988.1 ORF6N domain-containing protein [Comamonas piscis]WSO35771.1 ORF6N domain-containing protein [Comamonas piscis]
MSTIVTIGEVTTSVITYKEQRVCTTQQLGQLYGSDQDNIQKNFERNADRFEEGKHFFKIEGEELRQFKNDIPTDSRLVPKRTARLILWTERGAARHAKMLETDKAWDVFEQMEDAYFTAKIRQPIVDGTKRSTMLDRLPLYIFTAETVVKHRLLFSKVYTLINLYTGVHHFREMTKEQAAEALEFCDRVAIGQDTRNDWQRIANNQRDLFGEPPQLDMVQKLLLS